jgi:predicted ATPase/DNA-binding winged helix-turn-helix (wHTH) protein
LETYRFGQFTLDVARGAVFRAGEEIKLRPKVYEALKYLVQNPGRLIGKQELIQAVWPDCFVTDDSLVQCTVELRRALDDRDQQLLKTVPRRGYLFTAQVNESPAADPVPSVAPAPQCVRLPIPRTSLIGREREVDEAAGLLVQPDVRLLTITGAGGVGKTRLAIAVGSAVAPRFTGGVQFVGLGSISDPDLVGTALAKSLEIQETANRSSLQFITDHLGDAGPFLFVLDNFEQVLPAATVLADLLAACPKLKILVSSRAALRLYGEQEFPVASLEQDSAVQLFVQRAAAVRPNFVITGENSTAIREICARLDGLPLAIELAAARTRLLSPNAILDRLQSRLHLLTGGARDLPERQQTLRNTIDWSHDLLNDSEQKLFRRFSVFTGGCTMEAAEAVCNTNRDLGIDLFDGLSSLVDKNLVQRADHHDSEARFRMLETIREYAVERLATAGEEAFTRRAHAAYCLVLAEEGNPELQPAERAAWLNRCDLEIDNFRAALEFLFATRDLDWALLLSMALFRFWDMREHLNEGRLRLETVLQLAGAEYTKERAKICIFLGALSTAQGDFPAAASFIEQSLSLYEELGDRFGIAASLNALGISARDSGDWQAAQGHFQRSLACWRTLPDRLATARCLHNLANVAKACGDYERADVALREATAIFQEVGDRSGSAWSINQQGDIAREQGALDSARDFYEHALQAFREAGDRWGSARSLADLGYVYGEQGEFEAARAAYRESLIVFADLGHKRGIARALEGFACLAASRRSACRALELAAAAARLRHLVGAPLQRTEQSRLDERLSQAWQSLGEDKGMKAWSAGAAMSLERAIQHSLESPTSPSPDQ